MRYSILIIISIITLISCKSKEQKQLENFISKLPNDQILNIKTFDGNNQVVHPDVLFKDNKLIMAITPYPFYNDSLENPCLYKSINGIEFEDYLYKINPLVKTPIIDHNCDPDIILDKDGNIQLYYLETLRPYSNRVVLLSQNKNKFKRKVVMNFNFVKNERFIVSPAIAKYHNTKEYFMYFVNFNDKKNQVEYTISNHHDLFNKKKILKNNIKFPNNFNPWHLDIIISNNKYYLLTNGYYGKESDHNYVLFLAESSDLKHWQNNKEILSQKNIPDKELKYVYRSSGLISGNTLALWYSYVNKYDIWKLALKKLKI